MNWRMVLDQFPENSASLKNTFVDLRETIGLISTADDVHTVCLHLEKHLAANGIKLFGVTFCDLRSRKPTIRPFCGYPEALRKMSGSLKETGGCPVVNESLRLGCSFDLLQVDRSLYSDFMGKRYFEELDKLEHVHIPVVPLMLGQGLGIFIIGTHDQRLDGDFKASLVNTVCQTTFAMIDRFPDITKLFESRILSTIEAETLLLCSNGYRNSEIGKIFGVSELTVKLIFDSAARKLGSKSQAHVVAKALAMGEISNLNLVPRFF